jgi:nucleoside-diphosphate-sugar epimerase
VGGTLLRATSFDALFNSKNIEAMAGRAFGTVICAGAPAEKWKANAAPEQDRQTISRLTSTLARVRATRMILISTIDVYPSPIQVDESTDLEHAVGAPYGCHRLELERFVCDHFDTLVIRLPSLFGPGLKKNIVYDLLHDNQVDRVHADGVFQFYGLTNLWRDLGISLSAGLKLVNFATEPVSVAEIAQHAFGRRFDNRPAVTPSNYDMWSRHADLFGGTKPYLYDRTAVLEGLRAFVHQQRSEMQAAAGSPPAL